MPRVMFQSVLPVTAEVAYAWHERDGAFGRLQPPWESVEVVKQTGANLAPGTLVTLRVPVGLTGGMGVTWVAEHDHAEPGRLFRDVQRRGPFAVWQHTHRFEPLRDGRCRLVDDITYEPPLGALGRRLITPMVAAKLERMFAWRHWVTTSDLKAISNQREGHEMNILMTGASGLVGSALTSLLTTSGHQVASLGRSGAGGAGGAGLTWDPDAGRLDPAAVEGRDAVIHLAGENIAGGRWTAARKKRILDSRVEGTKLMARTIAGLTHKPRVLICASAIGYYGDGGDAWLDESSPAGSLFLSDVCKQWEAATAPASDAGVRVVHARFGVILSPRGGALQKMLLPFKLGAGGVIGDGRQYWSWVSIEDAIGALRHALVNESIRGPMNVVSPNPVTCRDFVKTLGRVLCRPTIFPMPTFAARLAFGEMADELFLAGARVRPAALEAADYSFRHPDLQRALAQLLGKASR